MTPIDFRVVDEAEREGPHGTRRRIDWSPVIQALAEGQTIEMVIPPHPTAGEDDDRGRKTVMLLRNDLAAAFPSKRLRTRMVDRDKRLGVFWAVPHNPDEPAKRRGVITVRTGMAPPIPGGIGW